MYEDEDYQESGITAELLVDDLTLNGAGYVLEVSTDGVEDKVVADGQFHGEAYYAELDFGDPRDINDILNRDLSNEHCMRITNKDRGEMTVIAGDGVFITHVEGEDEVNEHDSKRDLIDTIETFCRTEQ